MRRTILRAGPVAIVFIGSIGLLVGGLAGGGVALAATLSNLDTVEHSVRVLFRNHGSDWREPIDKLEPGEKPLLGQDRRNEFLIAPGARIERICLGGCVLRLDGSKESDYRIEGMELLSIEDGALYFDGEIEKDKPTSQ